MRTCTRTSRAFLPVTRKFAAQGEVACASKSLLRCIPRKTSRVYSSRLLWLQQRIHRLGSCDFSNNLKNSIFGTSHLRCPATRSRWPLEPSNTVFSACIGTASRHFEASSISVTSWSRCRKTLLFPFSNAPFLSRRQLSG